MAAITVDCVGAEGVRVDRQWGSASDTTYLEKGQSLGIDEAFLIQVSVAEAGKPQVRLSNQTVDRRLDVYSVRAGEAVRARPLAPQRMRLVALAEGERLVLIPVSSTSPMRSTPS